MAGSLNKVTLIGNLGRDPEFRSTQDGRELANITIATSESWKSKDTGERQEKTEWHRVVIFNDALVRVSKNYLKKGSKVYIEGQLQTRKWTDQAGMERYTTEVVLQNFGSTLILLDGKPGGETYSSAGDSQMAYAGNSTASAPSSSYAPSQSYAPAGASSTPAFGGKVIDDDIPF